MDSTAETTRGTYRAGRFGPEIRSDCLVTLELRHQGGLAIEVRSKVESLYGDSIREQAAFEMQRLGIEHAKVLIEDAGALPFAIAARIEAAALRAGVKAVDAPPGMPRPPAAGEPERDRLRRSRLYVPGNEPRYFVNAALYQPDAIILDLEDSVHYAEKDAARIMVRNALASLPFQGESRGGQHIHCERMVRINQLPLGLKDLHQIVPVEPDVILVPKAETPEQVLEVDARIADIQSGLGRSRALWLMPIIESAVGVENAYAIARASKRICSIAIGLEDYTADLGAVKTTGGAESLYARARIVNAAHAAGVQVSDSAHTELADMSGLLEWAQASRGLGFDGMGCVHPLQIEPIHKAFSPQEDEIVKALRIVRAYAAAQERGLGVVSLGSKMIDAPVVTRALLLFWIWRPRLSDDAIETVEIDLSRKSKTGFKIGGV